MKGLLATLLLPVLGAVALGEGAPVLVTPEWLAAHLSDPDLVVLNVAQGKRDYLRGHVPGARFLWAFRIAPPTEELAFERPSVAHLVSLFEELGVSNRSRIVLCGVNGNVSPTSRVYATLDYLGLGDRTSILDGGFEAWKAADRPVAKDVPVVKRGSLKPDVHGDAIVDGSYVRDHQGKPGITILDARAPQFYNGVGGGFPRPGRIPGAKNLFYTTLVDSLNRFLPDDSLRARFAQAGVEPGTEIITYCHVGQTASTDYVAAKKLGYRVHLYDGSFEDWSGRDDWPVELPAKRDSTR